VAAGATLTGAVWWRDTWRRFAASQHLQAM
jgi:hypothetical protein